MLTYFGTMSFYAYDVSDENSRYFDNLAFGIVLLIIFFFTFVVGAVVTVIDIFGWDEFWDQFYKVLNYFAAGCKACIRCEPCRRICWRGKASTTRPRGGEIEMVPEDEEKKTDHVELEITS